MTQGRSHEEKLLFYWFWPNYPTSPLPPTPPLHHQVDDKTELILEKVCHIDTVITQYTHLCHLLHILKFTRFLGGPKWPKICRGPNLILRTGPPFAIQILSRLDMTIHQAPPSTYHPYLSKNLSKSRLSKSFLGFLGDFWGGEPYLYSEFSYFQNLSVFSNISAWNRIVCNRER